MLLQRHAEPGLPPGRSAESPQKWREMAVFQRNSSVCTLVVTWRFLGWSSRDIVCCESSAFILRPSSFIGAAVALRAQGDGARGVRDVQRTLTHPGAAGAAHLYLLLDQYAP